MALLLQAAADEAMGAIGPSARARRRALVLARQSGNSLLHAAALEASALCSSSTAAAAGRASDLRVRLN
jgi:hypothetical protein